MCSPINASKYPDTEYTAGWRYRYEYTVDTSVTVNINNATGSELSQVLDAVVLAGGNVLQIQDIKVRSFEDSVSCIYPS